MANLSLVFDLLARDKASPAFKKVGDAAERTGQRAARSGSLLGSSWKAAAGVISGLALGSMFTGFVQDAAESARISRLTAAAIKSTGGAANLTAKQVGDLATAISNKTGADDEAIQSGANMLLTFTKVRNEAGKGNDIFNQATQASLDMATAMGTEPRKAALQLGKALNDPIKGVSALSKAGVSFTEQQKEQIKTLVESGDVLGAQKIILGEMQTQFGGAAKAAADPMQRLKTIAGNLGEQLGGYLLPVIGRLATWVTERAIPAVSKWAGAFQEHVLPALRSVGAFITDRVVPAVVDFAKWVGRNRDVIVPVVAALGAMLAAFKAFMFIKTVIVAVGAFNAVLLANPIGLVIAALVGLGVALFTAWKRSETFRNVVTGTWKAVTGAFSAAWDFIRGFFSWLGDFFTRTIPGWFRSFLSSAVNTWRAFRTAVSDAWRAVGEAISRVWNSVIRAVWGAIQSAARFLLDRVLKPVFSAIRFAWESLGNGFRNAWNNVIKPVFNAFKAIGETVRLAFSTAVSGIARLWRGLKDTLKAPIQAVIDVVWNNGIRKLWNKVNNLWGGDDLAAVRLASGGVLPGYTPGRDVHTFFSPTGGRLDLSGGEAVMRPEWTRAIGRPTIDMLNAVARSEGEAGLRRLMGGESRSQQYADGGVIKLPSWMSTGFSLLPGGGLLSAASSTYNIGRSGAGGMLGEIVSGLASAIWSKASAAAKKLYDKANDFTAGAFGPSNAGSGSTGSGWEFLWNFVRAKIPQARINSTFRYGDPGYHGRGKAIDFGYGSGPGGNGSLGLASINRLLHDSLGRNLAELIYDGAFDDRPDLKNGRPLNYGPATSAEHRNHVHAAVYDTGGILPPGLTLAYNGTGRDEYVTKGSGRTEIIVHAYTSEERRIARAIAERQRIDEVLRG